MRLEKKRYLQICHKPQNDTQKKNKKKKERQSDNLGEVDKHFVRRAHNGNANRTSTWILPFGLLALIHIHVVIYFIS